MVVMQQHCFLVMGVEDLWSPYDDVTHTGAFYRVGALTWWRHARTALDTVPHPMPHLIVMTPAGPLCLDCPWTVGTAGRYWTVTGISPDITVEPSLELRHGDQPTWHGWIRDGDMCGD